MIFHIAVCSPDPVLRGRVQRHCMEYYARRADACIVEQLGSTAALLQQEEAGSRYELYLIELPAANPCSGLQAAAELRRRGVRAPLAFLAHTTAYAYEAFRVDAMQYLHIPFRPEQLTALLDRATEPEYGPVIPVATAMGLRALPFADIEYLECTHHVVHYHLASGEDVASLSLRVPFSEVAKPLLADARFLQPHRSYVVNLAAAAQLSSGELWMRSGRLRGSPLLILLPVRSGSVKTAGRRAGEKGDQADQSDQRGFIPDENHAGIRDAVRDFQKPEEGNSGGTHF